MTNIEKLIDAMINFQANELQITVEKAPAIIINQKQSSLTKKPLSEAEVNHLENEFLSVFGDVSSFKFKNIFVETVKTENGRVFKVNKSMVPTTAKHIDINNLLNEMIKLNASDLHLSTGSKPLMRIDGDMEILEEYEIVEEDNLLNQLKNIAPKENIEEFEKTNDTDLAYEIKGLARFRTNIFRDHRGVCVVFRQIPSEIIPSDKLGIPNEVIELCKIPKGLILVTGPTGSGKSTTLAALIDHINSTTKSHIITIEDPVEFVHPNKKSLINQREVHTHTQSFKKALRAALREDPDVILVGEMRDLETIAIAIEMAVTGHLVFGTLHTATAVGTVDRIVDQFPADRQSQIKSMLADALIGVVSQVLCKRKEKGRVAAYEILIVTPSVSNLIRESKTFQIPSLMQTGKGIGMRLMNDSLYQLVEKGIVEPKEALNKAIDKDELRRKLKTNGLI
jgi:twitching motility protein PilT